MEFKDALREWRIKQGLSQAELAKRLGMRQGSISDIERGRNLPGPRFLVLLERYSQGEFKLRDVRPEIFEGMTTP